MQKIDEGWPQFFCVNLHGAPNMSSGKQKKKQKHSSRRRRIVTGIYLGGNIKRDHTHLDQGICVEFFFLFGLVRESHLIFGRRTRNVVE